MSPLHHHLPHSCDEAADVVQHQVASLWHRKSAPPLVVEVEVEVVVVAVDVVVEASSPLVVCIYVSHGFFLCSGFFFCIYVLQTRIYRE